MKELDTIDMSLETTLIYKSEKQLKPMVLIKNTTLLMPLCTGDIYEVDGVDYVIEIIKYSLSTEDQSYVRQVYIREIKENS